MTEIFDSRNIIAFLSSLGGASKQQDVLSSEEEEKQEEEVQSAEGLGSSYHPGVHLFYEIF